MQYVKETLAITPQGFAVDVAFSENKAPGTRHRLHVAILAMEITLEPR